MNQALFQAETGRDGPKNREKKISFRTAPTQPEQENSQKNSKKFKKLEKSRLHFNPKRVGTGRKKRKKKLCSEPILPDPS